MQEYGRDDGGDGYYGHEFFLFFFKWLELIRPNNKVATTLKNWHIIISLDT